MERKIVIVSVCIAAATALGFSLYNRRTPLCKRKTDTKHESKEENNTKSEGPKSAKIKKQDKKHDHIKYILDESYHKKC